MNGTSTIELSQAALKSNIRFLREQLGANVLISSVVKGNAYGHGLKEFITMALGCGINHFSVFSADEAFEAQSLRSTNDFDIMIMGDMDDDAIEWAIRNDIQYYIFEEDRLLKSVELAKKLKKKAKIHVEVETGMNRTGLTEAQLKNVKDILIREHDFISFVGLCTHFAGAESIANHMRIQKQIKTFSRAATFFQQSGLTGFIRHTACSAALIMYPKTHMEMVRVGILQYGFWPSPETYIRYLGNDPKKVNPLRRLITWKSHIIATKEIKQGEFIGYGTSFIARNKMRIAVVPVGYGHGYSRTLSNQGRILINGYRVGVVGMVNMNMLIADISEVPEAKKGDEVVLIGKQQVHEISVSSFSEYSNQLNYETLTRLPLNITRKIVE